MLNQRQLFVASRLFVAAGKAGFPFDLSKFSYDRDYALATLGSLSSQLTDTSELAIVAEAMLALSPEPTAAQDPARNLAANTAPSLTPSEPQAQTPPVEQARYVGRLR